MSAGPDPIIPLEWDAPSGPAACEAAGDGSMTERDSHR
jgi:hypothetical protein